MICSICNNEAIVNQAGGKEFFYCRTCKIEPITIELENGFSVEDLAKANVSINIVTRAFFDSVQKNVSPSSSNILSVPFLSPITACAGNNINTGLGQCLLWQIPRNTNTFSVYLDKWLPGQLHTADNFYQVDRNVDPIRLSGNWYNGIGRTIEEEILDLSVRIYKEGGIPDKGYMHPLDFERFCNDMGYVKSSVSIILLYTIPGYITIYPDSDCPKGFVYLCQMDTWAYDLTFNALYCTNPGFNGVLIL
jgi:hypothetical protein